MGLFSRPKDHLDPELFDYSNKLKEPVRQRIIAWAHSIIPKSEVYRLFMIGSVVGYKWDVDSDIDINVVLKESALGSDYWHNIVKKSNGATLKGTNHTINLFVQDFREPDFGDVAFGVYDLDNNDWEANPESPTSLPNPFVTNAIDLLFAKQRMRQIDRVFQSIETARNQGADVKIYLKELGQIFLAIDADRKVAYGSGWGTPRYSAENVIFKYIEDQGYLILLEDVVNEIYGNDKRMIFDKD